MDKYHVCADIYNLMKLLNITVKCPQNRTFVKVQVVVKENIVNLTLQEQLEDTYSIQSNLIFEDLNFIDQSFDVSQINGNQFSFHLQMKTNHPDIDKVQKPFVALKSTIPNHHETRKLILTEEFVCCCAVCSQVLFTSDRFHQVLPAGNYSEVAESSWCLCRCGGGTKRHRIEDFSTTFDKQLNCHNHTIPEININSKLIFVSQTSLLFEDEDIQSLGVDRAGSVVCSKCKTALGTSSCKLSDGYKRKSDSLLKQLHFHSLSFSFPRSSFQMWPSSAEEFEIKISNMMTKENNVGSRFVIEVRKEGNKLSPLVLATLLSLNDVIFSLNFENWKDEHRLKPINVVKILAKHCETPDDIKLGKEWLRDFSVDNIEIPERLSSTLLEAIKNNELLSGEEAMNCFGVSYLQTTPTISSIQQSVLSRN